jgi:hypothetical protein
MRNLLDIIMQVLNENEQLFEVDFNFKDGLTYSQMPAQILDAYRQNKAIGVAFVKADGSVRAMAFRRYLRAYSRSTKEKSEKELNVLQNNNLFQVYDTNLYIKNLKQFDGDEGMSAAKSYRRFHLNSVLVFVLKGVLYDFREKNKIKERYGDQVYNSLTKGMFNAIKSEENAGDNLNVDNDQPNYA